MQNAERFSDLKRAFCAVTRDPGWWWKVLIGGPMLFFPLTFLVPMGFTMEVLRRAKNDPANFILPSFAFKHWWRYACEGAVKLVIAFGTLLVPILLWCGISWAVALLVHFPGAEQWDFFFTMLLPFAGPISFFVTLPFCAVGCCRYLDTGRIAPAFDYATNFRIYRAGFVDFSLGAVFLLGVNNVGQTWLIFLPCFIFFGLCLVDNWFAPIYNEAARKAGVNK
jgi:hypothetical protein